MVIQPHFNRDLLLQIGRANGYKTKRSLYDYLSGCISYDGGHMKAQTKLDKGRLTWAQVLLIADALQMTPEEFTAVFAPNVFVLGSARHAFLTDERKRALRNSTHNKLERAKAIGHAKYQKRRKVTAEINGFLEGLETAEGNSSGTPEKLAEN